MDRVHKISREKISIRDRNRGTTDATTIRVPTNLSNRNRELQRPIPPPLPEVQPQPQSENKGGEPAARPTINKPDNTNDAAIHS